MSELADLPHTVDFNNPDYTEIFWARNENLQRLRKDPTAVQAAKIHYRSHPWDFINDWGMTYDPRNLEIGRMPNIPFILWPKQIEFLQWVQNQWKTGDGGIVEKTRDWGVTWLSVGFACTHWLFTPGFAAGFGSRKEDLVDRKGDFDSIFEKVRYFIDNVPDVFMPEGFNPRQHSGHMKLINPETDASITGEAGDNIGRGGRKSIYIVDEAAFIERQMAVDNALSATTNCQIDVSTYNGTGNQFYVKSMRFHGTQRKFICDWRDDPRKDDAWYAKQKEKKDEATVAQEIDRDPEASAANAFIPAKWVRAAVDLHKDLGWAPSGIRVTAFDPSDVGDPKGTLTRYGFVITQAELKTDGDIRDAIPWAYETAENQRADILEYDADGMGAPAMKLTLRGLAAGRLKLQPYYGSGEIDNPDGRYGQDPNEPEDKDLPLNRDKFVNFRAQAATWLRQRFEKAYQVRKTLDEGGVPQGITADEIISIDSNVESYYELVAELARPERKWTNDGKIRVESKKEMLAREVQSPTLFDCAKMAFSVKTAEKKPDKPMRVRRHRVTDRGVGR